MRTNIVIDDNLIAEAMSLTGIKTKREVVDTALRTLVRLRKQRAILALQGKITWDGNLEEMRQARFLAEPDEDYRADSG